MNYPCTYCTQVQKLLDYCPTVPIDGEGDDTCCLNDRSLAAVVALGLFAVESKLQVMLWLLTYKLLQKIQWDLYLEP